MSKQKVIIDLEKMNSSLSKGCAACGKKFSLGETAVLAFGPWDNGPKYIHENEAVFDHRTSQYFEKKSYKSGR